MTASYIEPKICVSWFLYLVFVEDKDLRISCKETLRHETYINILVHDKVLFTFDLSRSGDFRAIVAVRTLFGIFHNGDHIPI